MTDQNNLRIYDLTADQCALLDKMWMIEQWDELQTWVATLTPAQQHEVDVLTELMSLAITDAELTDCDTATAMLKEIGITV